MYISTDLFLGALQIGSINLEAIIWQWARKLHRKRLTGENCREYASPR